MRLVAVVFFAVGQVMANPIGMTLVVASSSLDEVPATPTESPAPAASVAPLDHVLDETPAPPDAPMPADAPTEATGSDPAAGQSSEADLGPGFLRDPSPPLDDSRHEMVDEPVLGGFDMTNPDNSTGPDKLDALHDKIVQTTTAARELRDILKEIADLNVSIDVDAATAAAAAPARPKARTVFLLSLSDTNDRVLSTGATRNVVLVEEVVSEQCQALEVPVRKERLTGTNFSFRALKAKRDELRSQITDADTLFVYISAHGAYAGDQHFFTMPNDVTGGRSVLRRDVWTVIKSLGARQTILMSDSCALQTTPRPATAALERVDAQAAAVSNNALGYLLAFQIGDLDLNASSKAPADNGSGNPRAARQGQFAIYPNDSGGGLFTRAFVSASESAPAPPVSWRNVLNETQDYMNSYTVNGIRTGTPFGTLTLRRQNLELIP